MRYSVLIAIAALGLSACDQETREDLGLAKTAPDEFSVVTRAPLSVPPDYNLRPPRPGATRPMEISTRDNARRTVFGVQDIDQSSRTVKPQDEAEIGAFLNKVGVQEADPAIRDTVDSAEAVDNRTTAEKLLFMEAEADAGDPIDPEEELKRLEEEGVVIRKRNDAVPAPADE